ncbi:extracellular solute-binding protein family 5 [Natrinema pellirubrum DSM 15624]|uniref:Extracellular solute-binding protein family 5 n=1 Tax=Natrinema pellirubrum (strain DSM 15624 / CIP 106293 / JCM 10476 / NCIMB 786 / 157) TaxID=797303 RepID=L0JJV8_NATP1|nr:ABC transporter substrate-binding protein [Natrinema pellirubrum]AGB31795.1 extracellular solute-binding protein, family 5 [Natrinema pellirubrum DSM 15624]ELY72349.1 extracellular solute-binding protein family 5 [Natrinema pellirubrum DSM 15624]
MTQQDNHDSSVARGRGRLTRRGYIATAATALGTGALAGCTGSRGQSLDPDVPDGVPETVETQYWREWETIDADSPPLDYSATAGAVLDRLPVEFSSEDDPWMREHALMVKRGLDDLGIAVELNDRPLNQLYAQSWATKGLEAVISMSTHGPDPQRGLDPNPLLMRRTEGSLSNYDNYYHPKLQELLTEQAQTTDRAEREELVARAQEIFAEDVGALITLFPNIVTAVNRDRWAGYVETPGNGPTMDSFVWTEVNLQPETDNRTYVKGVSTSMNSLNLPWAAGGAEAKRLTFIYDGLFDATPDLDVVPALATGGGFVGETTVELELREGVEWHDGEAFTAEDVKFTVEIYQEYTSSSQVPFYEPIDSVEVLGDHEVRFNLTNPDASFMTQRVVRSVILPKHRWEDIDNPSQHNPDKPVGTGPFEFDTWEQGTRFAASRNDGHWMFDDDWRADALGDQAERGPGIERVIWINVSNVDALIGSLQSGAIDAIGTNLSTLQAERAANADGIEQVSAGSYAPLDAKLMFSCPLVRDKEFRIALSKAVDSQGFVEDFLQGEATVPAGENPISPLTQWHNPDTTDYEVDVEEARTILEQAGYTWDGDGNLRYPNGEAWGAFVERIQPENTYKRRDELEQPDFS